MHSEIGDGNDKKPLDRTTRRSLQERNLVLSIIAIIFGLIGLYQSIYILIKYIKYETLERSSILEMSINLSFMLLFGLLSSKIQQKLDKK